MSSHVTQNKKQKSSNETTTSSSSIEESKIEVENAFLKDQVIRLNKELSSYQKQSTLQPPNTRGIDLPAYITDSEKLSPLLLAYDCRIEELSSFVERQGSVLDTLTQRSNDLLSENESLRSRLIPSIASSQRNHGLDHSASGGNNKDSKAEIKQLLSDKHLLEEQAELLVKEIRNSNQAIVTRDESISSLSSQIGEKLKIIQNMNETVAECRKKNVDLENELVEQIESLALQRSQNKTLQETVSKLQKKRNDMLSKVEGVGMDKQYLEKENGILSDKVMQSSILIQDLQNKLADGTNQYSKLNEKHLQSTRELDKVNHEMKQSTQNYAELMLRYSNLYEKERELEKLKREQSLKLRGLELDLAKAEAKCNVLQDDVNRLVLERQDRTENTVLRKDSCDQLRRRDQMIHMLKMKNTEMEIEVEKDQRESYLNKSSHQVMERSLQNERNSSRSEIENLHKEISSKSNQLKAEQLQKVEYSNKISSLQRELTALQTSLNARDSEVQRLREEDKRKSQEYVTSKMNLQTKIDDLNTKIIEEVTKVKEEKDATRLQLEEAINQNEGDSTAIQCKIQQLEKSMNESLQSNQNLRNQMIILTKQSTETERKIKSHLHERINSLNDKLDEQVEENSEILSNFRRISEQKSKSDVLVKQSNSGIYASERKLVEAEGKITMLSKQLHDNLSDQSEKVGEIQKLKMELRQLKMSKVGE